MGFFSAVLVGAVGTVAVTVGAPAVLVGALGFTGTGIAAGSFAAGAQAYFGNVAAGSFVAKLTSMAMLAPTP